MTKALTFEEISPKWAAFIKENENTFCHRYDNLGIDIADVYSCVVGEAHGGKQYWKTCAVCDAFGFNFVGSKGQELESTIQRFVAHWNKVHVK